MNTGSGCSVRSNEREWEAGKWFVIRQSSSHLSESLTRAWEKWVADSMNLAEFREYERVDELLRALPQLPLPTDAELQVRPSMDTSRRSAIAEFLAELGDTLTSPRARRGYFGIAFAVVATLLITLIGPRYFPAQHVVQDRIFQTQAGQHSVLVLGDDSKITLGGATRLGVRITNDTRHVTLYEGEALFNVTPNSRVPFEVDVARTRITALGTQFLIRRYVDQQVDVKVADGAVAVVAKASPLVKVNKGEEVSTDATGGIGPVHATDMRAVAWWLHGRRMYRDQPLSKVVEDLQLYFPRRIKYDPVLGAFSFTGVVDQNKPEEWVRGLQHIFPVEIDESDPMVLNIRCRHDCRQP